MGRAHEESAPAGFVAAQSTKACLFAQALSGRAAADARGSEAHTQADCERIAWVAEILPANECRARRQSEAQRKAPRELMEWLADISSRHEGQLREALRAQADDVNSPAVVGDPDVTLPVFEAKWDPSKHPRGGTPENRGWFSSAAGSGGSTKPPSIFDAVIRRNATVSDLTGGATPGMIRSSRLAAELQSAVRLPGDVSRAAAAGLGTGGKAVVNGTATAIKNVGNIGWSVKR